MTVYNDVVTMFRDIVGFIRTMGLTAEDILPSDDPRHSLMGFCWTEDASVRWDIPLTLLQGSTDQTMQQTRELFRTQGGRVRMIALFVAQGQQHVMSQADAEAHGIGNLIEQRFNSASITTAIDEMNSLLDIEPDAEPEPPPRTVWDRLEDNTLEDDK